MLSKITRKIFGSRNDRIIKDLNPLVNRINAFEAGMQALDDEQLKHKTSDLKQRFEAGETLEQLLDEAFAVLPRSIGACTGHAPLRRTAYRRDDSE